MIRSVLLMKCHSMVKAKLYIAELNKRGIYTFLANENTANLIPFGEGGYLIEVDADKLDEALTIVEEMDQNYVKDEDFREATQDDIQYEKIKAERETKKSKANTIVTILAIAAVILLVIIYVQRGRIL